MTAEPAAAEWHPKVRQFHDYWRRIHPAPRTLPGRQHFDPLAIGPLLPNILLIDIVHPGPRFRYRVIGTRLVDALGDELTGQWVDEAHPEFGPGLRTYDDYVALAMDGRARWRRGKPIFMAYVDSCVELERLLLPLAADGRTVDILLAVVVLLGADGEEV